MTTAQRVKAVLEQHGDSIRSAAKKTGVPKSTLALILQGSQANLPKWLALIANAYGIEPESLMGGVDPCADFEWAVRAATIRERFGFISMTMQDRLRMVVEFLQGSHERRFGDAQLAAAAGLSLADLRKVKAQWDRVPPDRATADLIIQGLCTLTNFSREWFDYGLLPNETGLRVIKNKVSRAGLVALRSGDPGCEKLVHSILEVAGRRFSMALRLP